MRFNNTVIASQGDRLFVFYNNEKCTDGNIHIVFNYYGNTFENQNELTL